MSLLRFSFTNLVSHVTAIHTSDADSIYLLLAVTQPVCTSYVSSVVLDDETRDASFHNPTVMLHVCVADYWMNVMAHGKAFLDGSGNNQKRFYCLYVQRCANIIYHCCACNEQVQT